MNDLSYSLVFIAGVLAGILLLDVIYCLPFFI